MKAVIKPETKILYPGAMFGGLIVKNLSNKKTSSLERSKRSLEKEIRENYPEPVCDPMVKNYETYYKQWGKTYPIKFQIETIKKGGKFPKVSALVDSMFLAELQNRILTSGHSLDEIKEPLFFDLANEGEEYLKLNGKKQVLNNRDIVLRDGDDVLASILYGPARRTSISLNTSNVLYFAWCPYSIDEDLLEQHLFDIVAYLQTVYEECTFETFLLK